jgi:ParB family chromosome partitioning protein
MAAQKKALGKGLSAILKDPNKDVETAADKGAKDLVGHIAEVDVDAIETNPFQPRSNFDKQALDELAASIREVGIIQPITLRKTGFNKYQLISGERRLRASKLAGLKSIPAYIRIADDQNMLELALIENIQREDLDAIEVALSYQRLMEECAFNQEQLGERVGKQRSTVTNYLRLLRLQPIIQAGIRDRMISMGHARALINVEDEDIQLAIYRDTIAKDLSVRRVEEIVRNMRKEPKEPSRKPVLPESYRRLRVQLREYFNSDVDVIRNKNGRGKISIGFENDKDLERIIKIINNK